MSADNDGSCVTALALSEKVQLIRI